ncbi:MAG: hypothetical protein MUE69_25650 [Myxococcota bacterium]|jgi:hypothetical protein|nr:hypothetical protein [Myxococcota bacterium]
MDSSSEHTAVTGAPTQVVVRRGDVIGERYEIRGRLRDDPFSHGFLALDQESEEQVLLRVVRSELLETADRNGVVRALRRFVGVGGRFLPGLLDADRDGPFVYATEPVPSGVTLRDVLDGRLREGTPLEPTELLPVVGYLDAALNAIPSSMRHGDVQAELVWVDRDRLELTGAFFVPALPAGAVAAVLQRHGDLRRRYAPELLQGIGGSAADRFGVGAIVHEALTLRPPPPPGESVSSSLGALAAPLAALLHPDLTKRARDLDALLETLSRLSGHPPLELDAGAFQVDRRMRPQRPSSAPPPRVAPGAVRTKSVEAKPDVSPAHVASSPPSPVPALARERRMSPVPGIDDLHTERLPALDVATAEALLAKSGEITKVASDPAIVSPPPRPKTAPASSKAPSTTAPSMTAPSMTAPSMTAPSTTAPSTTAPSTTAPSMTAPSKPSPSKPSTSTPSSKASVPPVARAVHANATKPRDVTDPPIAAPPKPSAGAAPRSAVVELEPLPARGDEGAHHLSVLTAVPKAPSEEKSTDRARDLDPRLVRAALGISMDSPSEEVRERTIDDETSEGVPLDPSVPAKPRKERTQELRLEDLEASEDDDDEERTSEGVPLDPSVPAKPRKEPTQELQLDELEEEDGQDVHPPTYGGTQNISIDELEQMAADHRRAAVPQDVKPVPRPRRDSTPPVVKLPALYDDGADAAGSGSPAARPRAPRITPVPVVPAAAMSATAAGTNPRAERYSAPSRSSPSRRTTLLWIAIALGVAIVLGSFAYAAWKQSRAEDERRQRLQERFEQLQRAQ